MHNDYPLAPEKLAVSSDMLSKYCKEIADKCEMKKYEEMKKYIDFNTEKIMNAANDTEKDFFKLIINSAYGKKLVNHAEKFLKYTSKPTYITH